MEDNQKDIAAQRSDAQQRVKNAGALFESITETLNTLLAEVRNGNVSAARKLPGKQAELETAITRCTKLEREFNEKFGSGVYGNDIDFDAIRNDIGCRLDRLRNCCGSQGFP